MINQLDGPKLIDILQTMNDMINGNLASPIFDIKQHLESLVFCALESNKHYQYVVSTKFMDPFVKFLIQNDSVQDLLDSSLQLQRYCLLI